MEDLIIRAKEILTSNQYINIASVGLDSQPWSTPVYAKSDSNLQFYWTSWVGAQHSINIRDNPKLAISIYDSTRKRGDNNRRCVYMQGSALELQDTHTVQPLLTLLYGEESKDILIGDYSGQGVKRIYKFTPTKFWLNDLSERQVTNQTLKMRIEVPFDELLAFWKKLG